MEITLFMAISANGMIAAESGGEDFLADENWQAFTSIVEELGNFIVGGKTYETVQNWEEDYGFDDFKDAKKIVVSDNPNYKLQEGYSLASSPKNAVSILEHAGFKKGLLAGGSRLNTSFIRANLIDKIILNIEPVVVGEGIPLFYPGEFQAPLELAEVKKIEGSITQLCYQVIK